MKIISINNKMIDNIDKTIAEMTNENNGQLLLMPNLENIADRAGVSMHTLKEYLAYILL